MAVRVHVDTDLGDDPDDLSALAYLLARLDVDLVGVTTVDDPDGWRADLARDLDLVVDVDGPAFVAHWLSTVASPSG
jgi:hypothetical protein